MKTLLIKFLGLILIVTLVTSCSKEDNRLEKYIKSTSLKKSQKDAADHSVVYISDIEISLNNSIYMDNFESFELESFVALETALNNIFICNTDDAHNIVYYGLVSESTNSGAYGILSSYIGQYGNDVVVPDDGGEIRIDINDGVCNATYVVKRLGKAMRIAKRELKAGHKVGIAPHGDQWLVITWD